MKILLISLNVIVFSQIGFSQKTASIKKKLNSLEVFMNEHIPTNHMSVIGYNIVIKRCKLEKETLVDDNTSHSTSFDLKNAKVSYEALQMDDESAEVYGFKDYWDVEIDGSWFHTELTTEQDAILMVDMLGSIQDSCK